MTSDVSKLGAYNYNMAYADRLLNNGQPPVVVTPAPTQGTAAYCRRNPGFTGDTVELSTQEEPQKCGISTTTAVIGGLAALGLGVLGTVVLHKPGKAIVEALEGRLPGITKESKNEEVIDAIKKHIPELPKPETAEAEAEAATTKAPDAAGAKVEPPKPLTADEVFAEKQKITEIFANKKGKYYRGDINPNASLHDLQRALNETKARVDLRMSDKEISSLHDDDLAKKVAEYEQLMNTKAAERQARQAEKHMNDGPAAAPAPAEKKDGLLAGLARATKRFAGIS